MNSRNPKHFRDLAERIKEDRNFDAVPKANFIVNSEADSKKYPPAQLLRTGIYLYWAELASPPPLPCYRHQPAPEGCIWKSEGSGTGLAKDRLKLVDAEDRKILLAYRYIFEVDDNDEKSKWIILAVENKNPDHGDSLPEPTRIEAPQVNGLVFDEDDQIDVSMDVEDQLTITTPNNETLKVVPLSEMRETLNQFSPSHELNQFMAGVELDGENVVIARNLLVPGKLFVLSDSSTKKNIRKWNPDDSTVEKLNGIQSYKFNNINGDEQLNPMADEVEVVFPEIVTSIGGKKVIDSSGFQTVLLGAFQVSNRNINAKLDKLEASWTTMQAKMDHSKAESAAMQARLDRLETNTGRFNHEESLLALKTPAEHQAQEVLPLAMKTHGLIHTTAASNRVPTLVTTTALPIGGAVSAGWPSNMEPATQHPKRNSASVKPFKDKEDESATFSVQSTARVDENHPAYEFDMDMRARLLAAVGDGFDFRKYHRIREDHEYVATVYKNKQEAIDCKLRYQRTSIPVSLLRLEESSNKLAILTHKNILGYCGELSMLYPEALAHDVIGKGWGEPNLGDEIYVQIMKHLTDNPRLQSIVRAWDLMCLMIRTVPPSEELANFCLNFLYKHYQNPSSGRVRVCASYCLIKLGRILSGNAGPIRSVVPQMEEITSFKHQPPCFTDIEDVEGNKLIGQLEIHPDMNVESVVRTCCRILGLKDWRAEYFGIFVKERSEDTTPPLEALRCKDFMGSVCANACQEKRKISFVFKQKIVVNEALEFQDEAYIHLLYIQYKQEVLKGNWPAPTRHSIVLLASIMIIIDDLKNGQNLGEGRFSLNVDRFLKYIPASWQRKATKFQWINLIQNAGGFRGDNRSVAVLEHQFITQLFDNAVWYYGMETFSFTNIPDRSLDGATLIGVSRDGVFLLSKSREIVEKYLYRDIIRWGSYDGSNRLNLVVASRIDRTGNRAHQTLSFETHRSKEICDYIETYTDVLNHEILHNKRG